SFPTRRSSDLGHQRLLVLLVQGLQLLHLALVGLDHLLVLGHPAQCGLYGMGHVDDRPLRDHRAAGEHAAQCQQQARLPSMPRPRPHDFPVVHLPLPGLNRYIHCHARRSPCAAAFSGPASLPARASPERLPFRRAWNSWSHSSGRRTSGGVPSAAARSAMTWCMTSMLSVDAEITASMSSMPSRSSLHTAEAWPCLTRKQRERSSSETTTRYSASVSLRPST